MSRYENQRWAVLEAHWGRRSERKAILPPKARAAIGQAGARVRTAAGRTTGRVGEVIPQKAKDAGVVVIDAALMPAVKGAVHLLELAADWAAELTDQEKVLKFHRDQGRAAASLEDLRGYDLERLDELTRRMPLQWGAVGAAEGAALGVLAMVPVAGGALAITADMVVVHVLSTAIATRVAYAYGFDASSEAERHMIDRMVRRTFTQQAAKAEALHKSALAFRDGLGRKNWSQQLRDNHKLMAALEKLMKQAAGKQHIPVGQVVKAVPVVAVAAGAGANAHLLRDIATQATRYAQTRFLVEKYGLALPEGLASGAPEPDDASGGG
jgi:EcsC protein family